MAMAVAFAGARLAFETKLEDMVSRALEVTNQHREASGKDPLSLGEFLREAGGGSDSLRQSYYRLVALLKGKEKPRVRSGAFTSFANRVLKAGADDREVEEMIVDFTLRHAIYNCSETEYSNALSECDQWFEDLNSRFNLRKLASSTAALESEFLVAIWNKRRANKHENALEDVIGLCHGAGRHPNAIGITSVEQQMAVLRPLFVTIAGIAAECNGIMLLSEANSWLWMRSGQHKHPAEALTSGLAGTLDWQYVNSDGKTLWSRRIDSEHALLTSSLSGITSLDGRHECVDGDEQYRISLECAHATGYALYWGTNGLEAREKRIFEKDSLLRPAIRDLRAKIGYYPLRTIAKPRYSVFFDQFESLSKHNTSDSERIDQLIAHWISCGHLSLLGDKNFPNGYGIWRCLKESAFLLTKHGIVNYSMWSDWFLLAARAMKDLGHDVGELLAITRAEEIASRLEKSTQLANIEKRRSEIMLGDKPDEKLDINQKEILKLLVEAPFWMGGK